MTRLSVFIASSLDGYIATTSGSLDWLESAAAEGEDYGWEAFIGTVDALAMGRGTWDHISHLDPLPFGARPVYVFTHRPPDPRPGVTFWSCSPREALKHWEDAGHSKVYLDGGRLISDFLGEGLVDDMLLTRVPILLGEGRPLFHPHGRESKWQLTGVESFDSGFVNLSYERLATSAPSEGDSPQP